MNLPGKRPQRSSSNMASKPAAEIAGPNALAPTAHQTASYIADICAELVIIAKAADLIFLAHLLTITQAEGESISEKDI